MVKANGHATDYRTHLGPIGGYFGKTQDEKWIFLIGAFPHFRDNLLDLLKCWNSFDSIANAVRGWNSLELEDAASERKCPAAVVRTKDEWRAHPQGQWLAGVPAIEVRKLGNGPPKPFGPGARPLSGIRVLDMTHIIAGPVVGRTLSEQGAEVLHLQSSSSPDLPASNLDVNIGKRSAFFDFGNRRDEDVLPKLLADADIFVDSYRAGSLARRGLSAERLAEQYPGIIHVYVNCYGAEGPWASRGGFDQLGQCVTGVAATEGGLDAPKLVPTYLLNDYLAGYLGALGALAALIRRSKEGGSYSVRVSLARSSMWLQDLGLLAADRGLPSMDSLGKPPIMITETPFGRLEHLSPVTGFSQTKAYWELPVTPLGASGLNWIGQSATN
jgi:hypothetical protein